MLKKDFHNCPSTFEVCNLKIGFGKIIEVVTVLLFDHLFSTSEGERRFAAEDQRLPGGGQARLHESNREQPTVILQSSSLIGCCHSRHLQRHGTEGLRLIRVMCREDSSRVDRYRVTHHVVLFSRLC